jgi:hypothetical protein
LRPGSGIRYPVAGLAILLAWTAIDAVLHRWLLAPLYLRDPYLWRPVDQLNLTLVSVVTIALIATFVATYALLVRPKSLRAGLSFGAMIGVALGIASGFGTYIHMPIPMALAWGWLIGGWWKALVAGGIVGGLIKEP